MGKKKKLEQWVKGRKSTLDGLKFVRMAEANSFGATMPRLHAKQLLEMEINLAHIE